MGTGAESAALEVIHPLGEHTHIPIDPLPFRIGRGPGNNLIIRDNRASRYHAVIKNTPEGYSIEDLESLHGTWVNGRRISEPTVLLPGDSVHFGFEDSYRLLFSDSEDRLNQLLNRLADIEPQPGGTAGQFARLRAVIEVARVLQTSLATDQVLAAVLDTTLTLTGAERAFLVLRTGDTLEVKLGRDRHRQSLPVDSVEIPGDVLAQALAPRHDLLSMSVETKSQNIICVPLVSLGNVSAQQTVTLALKSNTLGLIYLESRQDTVVPQLNLELLHTLALEASTVIENATFLERERQKMLLEQELEFARNIQQSLLPRNFPNTGWLRAAGSSIPSMRVAGDYFDLHEIDPDNWAGVIADVSGKGISSALLASLLQGAFLLGSDLAASLDEVVTKINGFIVDRAQREKYATIFYAVIHSSGVMEWVNAGHCAPILISATGEKTLLQSTGMPLGLRRNARYTVERLQLAHGDKILAFSDGVPEAENERKETFEGRLNRFVKQCGPLSAQEVHDKLMNEIRTFHGPLKPRDDMTVLVLEYCGTGQS